MQLHEWTTSSYISGPRSAPCSHFSYLTHSSSTDVALPQHVRWLVWVSILICRVSLLLCIVWFFNIFHSLHHSTSEPDFYFQHFICNKSPFSSHPWPQSHADWPDVPPLIKNISILISWTTVVVWRLQSWSMSTYVQIAAQSQANMEALMWS